MNSFETIAEAMGNRSTTLSTGLPQLDRIAPLAPGHLVVLIGRSGVGKSPIASHIADTVTQIHERGALIVSARMTLDALDATVSSRMPALVVVDPLAALVAAAYREGSRMFAMPRASGVPEPLAVGASPPSRSELTGGEGLEDVVEQQPVHPAELGRLGMRLKDMAMRHRLPILLCHRYAPIRDSVTQQIVSTESANPLLDVADMVAEVRVQADPTHVGLEIVRNRLGPITNLRVPLPPAGEDGASTRPDRQPRMVS